MYLQNAFIFQNPLQAFRKAPIPHCFDIKEKHVVGCGNLKKSMSRSSKRCKISRCHLIWTSMTIPRLLTGLPK